MSHNTTQLRQKHQASFKSAYKDLNPEQKKAVDVIEGSVMVIAGPGTGKTQILAVRIGRILEQQDVQAHNILCLTFTDAATIAMRKRLVEIIGPEGHKVHIFTFHGFCNQVIQENLDIFGNYRRLEAISDLEKMKVIMEILDELPRNHILKRLKGDPHFERKRLQALFELMKKENLKEEDIEEKVKTYLEEFKESPDLIASRKSTRKGITFQKGDFRYDKYEEEVRKYDEVLAASKLLQRYQLKLDEIGRYDFQDMILWVLNAFKQNPDLLSNYQERYQYFLVDEYQDTNGAQNEILEQLITFMDYEPNVFVVGDDDQAIYKFQGANLSNIQEFAVRYKPKMIVLKTNYRSNTDILDRSSELIKYNNERIVNQEVFNLDKDLIAYKDNATLGAAPQILQYDNIVHEQADIVNRIIEAYEKGENINEYAVLYRNHSQVEKLVDVLEKKNIPININRKIDILKLPLIDNILNILHYISIQQVKPNSEEIRLFELLHYHFFAIDVADIAKIAIHMQSASYSNPLYWKDMISDPELMKQIGIKKPENLYRLNNLLNKWIADISTVTLQSLFENVLNEGHILQYILQHQDKTWLLQVVSTLFDSIKNETAKNPELKLSEYLDMIGELKSAEIPLQINKVVHSDKGVQFITSHSAKGLEFEKVFLIGASSDIWKSKSSGLGRYRYPKNINEDSDSGIEDERRLFFVAMTRAKKYLYISFSDQNENGKAKGQCQFIDEILSHDNVSLERIKVREDVINEFVSYTLLKHQKPINLIDSDLIDKVLSGYKLSVTSLNKYLRCPMTFYFETILRVPTARTKYLGFGNAIHKAFQLFYEAMEDHKWPPKETFIEFFKKGMKERRSHFTDQEFKDMTDYGEIVLNRYYDKYFNSEPAAKDYKLEIKIEHAEYKGVPIKGVLDKVEVYKDYVNVIDYKTGNWTRPETKKKLRVPDQDNELGGDYWRQIVYYKLLIESDKKHDWDMNNGVMEFIEPRRNTDIFFSKSYAVSPTEIEIVGQQIEDTWKNIHAHKFNQLCEDEKCYWCNFVRNDYVFSDELEQDLLEEIQDS